MFDWKHAAMLAVSLCFATVAAAQQSMAPQAVELPATVTVEIDPRGNVVQVEPDTALPETLRELLARRIAGWQFEAPKFRGQPVHASTRLELRLQPAPTTTDGYGVRILSAGIVPVIALGAMPPPRFTGKPPAGNTHLVYVVSIDPEGRVVDVEPALPLKRSRFVRSLDQPTRHAIKQAPPFRRTVDGTPVACRVVFSMLFVFDGTPAPDTAGDIRRLEQTLPDLCPKPLLLTEVAGTAL